MKATGIIRKIDKTGRVVLPKDIRNIYNIKCGDELKLYISDGDKIVIEKLIDDNTNKNNK